MRGTPPFSARPPYCAVAVGAGGGPWVACRRIGPVRRASVQNWWSYAGSNSRPSTNSMNLQPIASYFLPDGWSVGYSGNILANWEANASNTFTVPIGLAVSKVHKLGKLPVRFALALQWMPEQPDRYGQKWNVQVTVAPVLPKLIRGNLIDPRGMSFGLGR